MCDTYLHTALFSNESFFNQVYVLIRSTTMYTAVCYYYCILLKDTKFNNILVPNKLVCKCCKKYNGPQTYVVAIAINQN